MNGAYTWPGDGLLGEIAQLKRELEAAVERVAAAERDRDYLDAKLRCAQSALEGGAR